MRSGGVRVRRVQCARESTCGAQEALEAGLEAEVPLDVLQTQAHSRRARGPLLRLLGAGTARTEFDVELRHISISADTCSR